MKLELGYIHIHDIQLAAESKVENGVLYVDAEAVKKLVLEDEQIASVEVDVARPGENVRITPVKDVIEPRVKVEGPGGMFPGVISKVETVGSGKTHVLKGAAVVTTGKIVGFQEGIIDMSGIGAQYTPFSKTNNLVLVIQPVEGLKQHDHEHAVRMAGLKPPCTSASWPATSPLTRPKPLRPCPLRKAWTSIRICPGLAMCRCCRARACSMIPTYMA